MKDPSYTVTQKASKVGSKFLRTKHDLQGIIPKIKVLGNLVGLVKERQEQILPTILRTLGITA